MKATTNDGFRAAVVDVGSNSVRLMIADVEGGALRVVSRSTITTRLMSGLADGAFTDEAIARTSEVIAKHVRAAREAGATRVACFGTSAMRDAANASALSLASERACGAVIETISGEEEARLAYRGASRGGKCGVIDVGGGSTELLLGVDGEVDTAVSARVGAVRLAHALGFRAELPLMLDAARCALERAMGKARLARPDAWVGVGGTITTLAAMCLRVNKYASDAIEGYTLTARDCRIWLEQLAHMDVCSRRALPGLSANRADIIPFGAAIVLSAMRLLGMESLRASDHDNLEGYIRTRMM